MRPLTSDEAARIPGLLFLTHVGDLRSTETATGSSHTVQAIVRVPSDSPIMRGRTELTHVVMLEASNNLSHWMTAQVPAVAGVVFKPPTAVPRDMGMPSLRPGVDIEVHGELCLQKTTGRWRAEVEVRFFRPDGSRAETVAFPLVERKSA
ncbi:MAG: hypothetical protein AB7F99_13575 [Vicinamibacterales bacterium]